MYKIFFVCGETSGDMHAAHLVNELYKIISPNQLIIKAIGGNYLKASGVELFFDCKYLASMGLTEVIKNLSLYLNLERELLFELISFNPNILVFVDFPGFNLRLLKKVKQRFPNTKTIYYFPPQVWAWNEGRTKTLAKYCDLVLCGLPFEEDFHRKRGVNAIYIGNPILSELEDLNREQIREELGITTKNTLIGLFPGSRESEIHYMLQVLLHASELLFKAYPNYKFMLAQAPTISNLETKVSALIKENHLLTRFKILPPGNNHKLLYASDFVWLTSGTVTLEAALYETPMILGYKGNPINYFLYLLLKKINLIGLPNIILGEKMVPELIQNDATSENYYQITKECLEVHGHVELMKKNLKKVKEKLTTKNASKEAALKISQLLSSS